MAEVGRNATLKDVAKRAEVSPATASRVLANADYPVSPKLRQKVLKAAADLKYVPNVFGKLLKSNVSNAIGIIVPSLQNPFYNQVITGIESVAAKSGHEIRLFSSHRSISQERHNIQTLIQSRIMALIIISIDNNPNTLNEYTACGGKVVLLESDFELKNAITVDTDFYAAGSIAAKHLIDLGHKYIAFLTTPLTKSFRQRTLSGVRDSLHEAGINFSAADVFEATAENESNTNLYEFEVGKQLTEKLLECGKKYTAIIAINDLTAFGVIQTLTHSGIPVPENVSVIGLDNIIFSVMVSPPLTTVELPSDNMGRTACQMLISAIDADESDLTGISFKFPSVLRIRSSTKPVNHSESI